MISAPFSWPSQVQILFLLWLICKWRNQVDDEESRKEKTKSNPLLDCPLWSIQLPLFFRRNGWAERLRDHGLSLWGQDSCKSLSSCSGNYPLWVDVYHCMNFKRKTRIWKIVSSGWSQAKSKQRYIRSRKSCQSVFKILYMVETDKPWIRTKVHLKSCSGCPGYKNVFSFRAYRYWHSMEWASNPYEGGSDLGDTK